jgi:molybdopterin converting factor small subunit
MNLTVRYFAIFREAAGTDSETVSTDAASARELFAEMGRRNPGLTGFEASLVAINDEMSDWDTPLSEGDEVLFFPPVAGG